jgi:arylsulfatase A-like enzyme
MRLGGYHGRPMTFWKAIKRLFRWRLRFRWALAFCTGSVLAADPGGAPAASANPVSKPNIIFILADDLGYGDLGCYGQQKIQTPNLDRLAAEGIRFTSCYAGSTVCAPSRACLMTGLHTGHVRIRGNAQVPLAAGDLTVAEVLKGAGYHTAAIGKWGLGLADTPGAPNKKGFDEWFGYLDQVHAHDYYTDYLWRNNFRLELAENRNNRKGQYTHDFFTRAALNFITANTNQPFFLYLAYTIPHANNERKDQGMEVPSDAPYTNESWPQPEKNKAAMITRLDADVGRLLARLRELKMESNTVVFFSSDNGPHQEGGVKPEFFRSAGSWRGIKRDLYEGGIRVPMLAWWPGRIQGGRTSDQVWTFWDFLPTVADLAGAPVTAKIDGISMRPALLGKPQKNHEFLYWEFHEDGSKQAVRMGDWKAVRLAPGKPLELYNLKSDLSETNDVAGQNPATVNRIEDYLKTARTESETWPLKPPKAETKSSDNQP